MIPLLKDKLGNNTLSYIFISHFESDECGGLSLLKEHFPNAKPICSQVTARQLMGFGFLMMQLLRIPAIFFDLDFKLKFISYPSEMHLWEGLMVFEESRGLLFSSDLFISRGVVMEPIVHSTVEEEIQKISPEQIPSPMAYIAVQQSLKSIPIKYIAPGHGYCLKG